MSSTVSNIEALVPPAADGWRLDRALATALPQLSRERLKALISAGSVASQDGSLVRDPATKARAGALFTVAIPEPRPAHNEAQDIPLVIAFEDEHLIVVDKPAGLVVHPAAGNLDGTLVNALLHHCAGQLSGIGGVARPGIVHRIDKDTSGLMVAAKTDRAHEGLAAQFAEHSIDRRYKAIVAGVPLRDAGSVDAPLARSPHDRKKMAIVNAAHGKRAVTHWRVETTERRGAGRVPSRDRTHAPGACSHGIDRPSAARRSGLWARARTAHEASQGVGICTDRRCTRPILDSSIPSQANLSSLESTIPQICRNCSASLVYKGFKSGRRLSSRSSRFWET